MSNGKSHSYIDTANRLQAYTVFYTLKHILHEAAAPQAPLSVVPRVDNLLEEEIAG